MKREVEAPRISMFKMVVNLYIGVLFALGPVREITRRAYSANCSKEKKSPASQYLRHLKEVTPIDQVHAFIGTIKDIPESVLWRFSERNTSILSLQYMFSGM